jgi:hypothetical protein
MKTFKGYYMTKGMTIEKILLAKNRSAFDRIIKMFQSLIIKNEIEALKYETTESIESYNAYEGAFEEADTVLSYNFNENELMKAGFTPMEAIKFVNNPLLLQHLINDKTDNRAKAFITLKRNDRIKNYIELNPYYRMFLGLPVNENEYIYVKNYDKQYTHEQNTVLLHEVKYENYPKTYNKLFTEREIKRIYEKYNYIYLKFFEKPLNPYNIHNKKQYEICYYKANILQGNELQCFFESYTIAREEIMSFDYIEMFERTYDRYVEIMFIFILFYTFSLYCSKTLQRYAARDYTDDEIFDIIDSNNLSNLKSLNIGLLRRVVDALPDLQATIGTKSVIDIIFDIVADNSLAVKEYYLEKKFNVDENGNIHIEPDKTYDKNVELVFKEVSVKKGDEVVFSTDRELTYDEVTAADDSWGGVGNIEDGDLKANIKKEIKLELLQKDFSSTLTKYMTISKIVDMYTKTLNLSNKLGIFYQLNEIRDNFLKENTYSFHGLEVTSLSIYAAWCLVFASLHNLDDPDYIVKEASTIEDVLYLRNSDQLSNDALASTQLEINLGNGFKRKLNQYFSEEELQKYLTHFTFSDATSISDILKQYDANYEIIKAIDDKMNSTSDYDEYVVWETIKKANTISKNVDSLFQGYTNYSEYIEAKDPDFWSYLEPIITDREIGYRPKLRTLLAELQETYTDYVSSISQGQIVLAVDETSIAGGENIAEIALLFNEFMSYYTQLLKYDFKVGYDDPNNNSLHLLYAKVFERMITHDTEILALAESIISDRGISSGLISNLELVHYLIDISKSEDSIELTFVYEKIKDIMKTVYPEHLGFDYIKFGEKSIVHSGEQLSLVEAVSYSA